MMHRQLRFLVPGAACALALFACLVAGCGGDESSDAATGKMPKPREAFKKPAEYMKDPKFQKVVTEGRKAVDTAVALRDQVATRMRARLAETQSKLGANATEAAALAALEKDPVWNGLKTQLKDAETAVREARAKLLAASREAMKKPAEKISK